MRLIIKLDVTSRNKKVIYINAILISILNLVTVESPIMAYAVIALEVGILLFKFILGDAVEYIVYYIIIFSTSIEFSYFAGIDAFYSIKNLRIAGLNLGIYLLIPMWVFFIKKSYYKNNKKYFNKIGKWLIGINFIALVVGLLNIVINDNNIRGMEGYISLYIGQVYYFLFIPISIYVGMRSIMNKDSLWKINTALQASLVASSSQLIIAYITKTYGNYDGIYTLMSTVLIIFLPFLIMLACFKKYNDFFVVNLVFGLLGLLLSFMYNASGKLFIITAFVMCAIYFVYIKNHNAIKKFFFTFVAIFAVLIVITVISILNSSGYALFNSKLDQVLSMISFWQPSWIENMDLSPKIRFGEFINIFMEYMQKPLYILTGKGYLGSVKDYCGWFYSIPKFMRETGFSDSQFANNSFYDMHELSKTLLIFGGLGMMFWVKLLKILKKYFTKNPWIIIGVFWVVVYYGYSFTITTFGATALFYGLLLCDKEKENNNKGIL